MSARTDPIGVKADRVEHRGARFVFLTEDGGKARFVWRLHAANNRPLGRAGQPVGTLEQCRDQAAVLVASVASTSQNVRVVHVDGYWMWRLQAADVPVVSTHRYQRRVECLRGFTQFAAVAPTADPARGVVRVLSARALRQYVPTDDAESGKS